MRRFVATFAEVSLRFEVAYSEMYEDTRAVVTCLDMDSTRSSQTYILKNNTYILKNNTFMAMCFDSHECRETIEKNFLSDLLHKMYSEMMGDLILEAN